MKDLQLLKYEGISSKSGISIFVQLAGRLTRLDEQELKICEHMGKLNSKKFELEKEIENAIKELDQYDLRLIEKHQSS